MMVLVFPDQQNAIMAYFSKQERQYDREDGAAFPGLPCTRNGMVFVNGMLENTLSHEIHHQQRKIDQE